MFSILNAENRKKDVMACWECLFPLFVDSVWFGTLLWIRSAWSESWGRLIRPSPPSCFMLWPSIPTAPARKEQVQRCRPPHAWSRPPCWWTGCRSPSRSTLSPSDRSGTWNLLSIACILMSDCVVQHPQKPSNGNVLKVVKITTLRECQC